ncbi:MAG: tRNA (adenosine(37)-N6)-threonylcarbamoyltransferase complex transferase subunit TsaD [Cyanobacteria bacterium SW_9_44_58]|nr:MAG: tRNA (adenosine(37)-N6)-threonylcarbamoyltransferase complex transferase subunit TsaD [Cyanobacteria bacterium SW_9_44_58]
MSTILAIETSCDETGVAIVKNRQILSNIVASQIDLHKTYGGVVPEVASRQHLEAINPCLEQALQQAQLDWDSIDGIAVTVVPGLVGALLVGLTTAKTLAIIHNKPLLGIHHLEGHIYASYLSEPTLEPPFLCLLVSGGHTSLIAVRGCGDYTMLGGTRDDAVGEAFDKTARLLGLGYPGGPAIDRAAQSGNPHAYSLPKGKVSRPGGGYYPYEFSFSGLKTAVSRLVKELESEGKLAVNDLAASFQETVARSLSDRTVACALEYHLPTIVVGGGVAANRTLREKLTQKGEAQGLQVHFPPMKLCTDNAAMIACAGVQHYQRDQISPLTLSVASRLSLTEASNLYLSTVQC